MVSLASACVLSLASIAAAGPTRRSYNQDKYRRNLPLGTAVGGALDLPTTATHAPSPTNAHILAAQADLMTITVVNSHGNDISTIHTGPTPVSGTFDPGRMANGESSSFVVAPGWQGNIAINDAQFSASTGDESLIEASFVDQGAGFSQGDVNISFVNGFSAAIVCWCNENNIMTGCNKDLSQLGQCPDNNSQNSCRNPLRPDLSASQPTDFFRPCFGEGGAYTFPMDSQANNLNAKCPGEQYTCCVGSACPSNPNF